MNYWEPIDGVDEEPATAPASTSGQLVGAVGEAERGPVRLEGQASFERSGVVHAPPRLRIAQRSEQLLPAREPAVR
jgi:hypothetical protein